MAMDKTTTRRMIGAIVLVLVAALVLAYLLKSKDNKPDVVQIQDVTLPSSPILAFPGEGGSDVIADQEANVDKAGLDIIPNGLQDSSNQGSQKQQVSSKDNASSGNDTKADDSKKQDDSLKKADVVSLGNSSKVSSKAAAQDQTSEDSNDNGATEKESASERAERRREERKKQQARLVNEKKLPEYRDRSRKPAQEASTDKEIELTEEADVSADSTSSEGAPTAGYSIQILATGSESKANAVKKEMIDEGYPAYIVSVNDGALHRVRIGSYQEKDEASSVQDRMKRRYTKNTGIQESLVVSNK